MCFRDLGVFICLHSLFVQEFPTIIPVILIGVEVSLLLLCCFNAPNGFLLLISSCKHQFFFQVRGYHLFFSSKICYALHPIALKYNVNIIRWSQILTDRSLLCFIFLSFVSFNLFYIKSCLQFLIHMYLFTIIILTIFLILFFII